jgi:dienelactone hydrolase
MPELRRWRVAFAIAAMLMLGTAEGQEHVSFPSLDGEASAPVVLTALWFPAASVPAPAVALFHGCGGIYDRHRELNKRMREYAALLNGAGYHVLVVDSLTPRYETELCTQRTGKRRVTLVNRRHDALGAVAYLAERSDVDARRIGIIGWSNGGGTVLAAIDLRHPDVAAASVKPAFAVAFYPDCGADAKRAFEPATPLLMLIGQADDWTPAAPCRALARNSAEPKPEIDVYAGAYHDFDGDSAVRLRKDIPNGVNPGQGVHVGGNAPARIASQARLLSFLAERG